MINIERKPETNEYGSYYQKYVALVKGTDIIINLMQSRQQLLKWMFALPTDKWDYAYAEGKWTIKESIIHIIDVERVFAYRALRIGRGDTTPLASFDEGQYAITSKANDRLINSIMEEYDATRTATLHLFKNLPLEAYDHIGTASNQPASPLALAYIIVGHQLHHQNLFAEKYHLH